MFIPAIILIGVVRRADLHSVNWNLHSSLSSLPDGLCRRVAFEDENEPLNQEEVKDPGAYF